MGPRKYRAKRYKSCVTASQTTLIYVLFNILSTHSTHTHTHTALFRRGTAYSQLHKPHQAATDFERVLHFEPNNKKAQYELNVVRKTLAESGGQKDDKKMGRRIQIEEVDEPEEEAMPPTKTTHPPATVTTPPRVKQEPPPPLCAPIQAIKDEGNQLFRAGQYGTALDKYTNVIVALRSQGT